MNNHNFYLINNLISFFETLLDRSYLISWFNFLFKLFFLFSRCLKIIKVLNTTCNYPFNAFQFYIKGYFRTLNLEDNVIGSFEKNSFGELPNLVEISFNKNLFTRLDFEEAFGCELVILTRLSFKFNRIIAISENFFAKFPTLSHLDLSDNNFHSLSKSFFLNLPKLETLLLSNNQILTIDPLAFDNLLKLKWLDLKNNLLYEITTQTFRHLSSLKELNLSMNKFEFVAKLFFSGLSNLTLLDLSENQLKYLDEDTFDMMPKIETLILSFNGQIKEWTYKFSNLKLLKQIYISKVGLSFVRFSSLFSKLTHLDLSHNPLERVENMNLFTLKTFKFLNMSNTNRVFVEKVLNFSGAYALEQLDLSFNNLTQFSTTYFNNLK